MEISESGKRHFRSRGENPDALLGMSLARYSARSGEDDFEARLHDSGLLSGDALLFRFIRNYEGRGHATVYEPIFEDGKLIGILNYVTDYFELPASTDRSIELIEVVRTDAPSTAEILHRGALGDRRLRSW